MTLAQPAISVGFTDPVHDAQAAFRNVLEALSRPGRRFSMGAPFKSLTLGAAMAHVLLALADDDTPVWWQYEESSLTAWLRFHTGAPIADTPCVAAFGVLTDVRSVPLFSAFAMGSVDSPEGSTTLILEVPSFDEGPAVELRGPGIKDMQVVRIAGLPDNFWTQWQANHGVFPQGVDIVFTCADAVIGLPRTTRVRRVEGL